jgi:type VI protein secretion system component VasK
MSVTGVSNSLFAYDSQEPSNVQQFREDFQQLGQDLQAGNLSAAQADFATLQQLGPQASPGAFINNNTATGQEFSQLGQDLQAGNVTAAQQDYSTIVQGFQNRAQQAHEHHHGGGADQDSQDAQIGALFQQLGQLAQSVASGNATAAQQAYSTLQQEFQQFAQANGLIASAGPATQPNSNTVAVTA